jgi:hypothetical protein
LRVKLVYNHRHSTTEAAFLPLFIGPDAGNGNLLDTISVDATNPFNPFGVTLSSGADGTPANYSTIRRRFVEGGQRVFTQDVNTFSGTVTVDGSFFLGTKKWYWDANAVLGVNDAHQIFTGNLNAAKLARALGPVANCTGDCVPFNLFGGAGSITPAMLNYVTFDERDKSSQQLYDFTANLSGELFDLPAGPVGVAIGFEHRTQKASYDPDPVIVAGLGADVPTSPARIVSNSTARSGIRTIRRSAAARRSPHPACGNRSPICCSAAAMQRAFARRASANSMPACRAATRRSTTPAPAAPAACSRPTQRSGRIASLMAYRPTAAITIRPADSWACSPRAIRR